MTTGDTAIPASLDLSIIIVSWNVRDLLDACLGSVYASLGEQGARFGYEIIVIDGASHDGSAEMVADKHPGVQLISLAENVGFTRANNLGLQRSRGRYLLFLNPDTVVMGNALPLMHAYMRDHPDIGVLGPMLLSADGTVQSSRRRFPTLATAFMESPVLQEWLPNSRALRRYTMRDLPDDVEQDVDWVYGACFLVRRQVYEQVGPLDEAFFMYSEETDWMRRIKGSGWRVAYLPTAKVIHHGGQSSAQVVAAQHIYFQSSKVYYFRKHFGWLAGELVRCFLLASYAHQWLSEGAKWLLGHKRPLRAHRVRTYGKVIATRLTKAGRGL